MAVKYNDGTFGMGTEWLHDFIFDRYRLVNGNPLETALFRDKAGSTRNGVVLTIVDTNNQGDRVPTRQKWYLWDLTVEYQQGAVAAMTDANLILLQTWMAGTLVKFHVENLATLFTAPLSYFKPTMQLVSAPVVDVSSRFIQGPTDRPNKDFRVPMVLEENAVWHLDLIETAASNAALDNSFVLFSFDRELYRQGG